jgi:hypothetical protein
MTDEPVEKVNTGIDFIKGSGKYFRYMVNREEIREGLAACPVCADELLVQEYRCRGCGVVLKGAFRRCELCALPEELLHFVGVFLEAEGNFRSVERRIGISYPTVKARLASVNARLAEARLRADAGFEPAEPDEPDAAERRGGPAAGEHAPERRGGVQGRSDRLALLRDLRAGHISVDDALRKLR